MYRSEWDLGCNLLPRKIWQEGSHFLFSVCSYITLNKLFFFKGLCFSFAGKKKSKLQSPNTFDSCTCFCAYFFFSFFGNCIVMCFISSPDVPNAGLQLETWSLNGVSELHFLQCFTYWGDYSVFKRAGFHHCFTSTFCCQWYEACPGTLFVSNPFMRKRQREKWKKWELGPLIFLLCLNQWLNYLHLVHFLFFLSFSVWFLFCFTTFFFLVSSSFAF